jgi:phosphate starvation-inducible PhoH-like protein
MLLLCGPNVRKSRTKKREGKEVKSQILPRLNEKIITIENMDPVELLGAHNSKLALVKKKFPKLKIISRGDGLKAIGPDEELEAFERIVTELMEHYQNYNQLTESNIERVLESGLSSMAGGSTDVLLHGTNGRIIKARTSNQRKMVTLSEKNDMVFAIGPAGTGKTYTAVALAVRALKRKEVRRIILTRPAVEAGENLGFLPGDLKEKLDPYLQPLYDALRDMIPAEKLAYYLENHVVQIAPLAFMRGRTLDNAFVILDEAQNTTHAQMKMFLTRMGKSAKFIVTGDKSQIDLPRNQRSGLVEAEQILKDTDGIALLYLDEKDVIRHRLVKKIIKAYDEQEKKDIKE